MCSKRLRQDLDSQNWESFHCRIGRATNSIAVARDLRSAGPRKGSRNRPEESRSVESAAADGTYTKISVKVARQTLFQQLRQQRLIAFLGDPVPTEEHSIAFSMTIYPSAMSLCWRNCWKSVCRATFTEILVYVPSAAADSTLRLSSGRFLEPLRGPRISGRGQPRWSSSHVQCGSGNSPILGI